MERECGRNSCATDSTSDKQFANNKNPMLNHVILTVMFSMVPFKLEDFKNFRLVSRIWNETAVPFMHKNAWLNLSAETNFMLTLESASLLQIPLIASISDCLHKFHELTPLLLGALRFKKCLIRNGFLVLKEPDHTILFWEKFGPQMTHLEICDTCMSADDFRRIIVELTPNLQVFIWKRNIFLGNTPVSSSARNGLVWDEGFRPKQSSINKTLTHLTLLNVEIGKGGLPFNWIDIICHFPNIKNLKLGLDTMVNPRPALRSFKELLQAVILVRENCGQHYLAQLETLDIIEIPEYAPLRRLPRSILLLLRQLAFPLSAFALDIGDSLNEADKLELKNTVESYSTTLRNITVYQSSLLNPSRFYFQLPHLTKLMSIGYIPENLDFLNYLPMLKTCVLLDSYSSVHVANMKNDWSANFGGVKFAVNTEENQVHRFLKNTKLSRNFRGVILANLETLVVGTQLVHWQQMESMAKLMPNIKTLQLGLENPSFRRVCKYWSQIEHIHVEPMDVDEDGILGVRNGERYCWPNITDLKSLKTISLGYSSVQRRRMSLNLTDGDVAAAVLLPNLEAALNGREVEIYRQPATASTGSSENDDSD